MLTPCPLKTGRPYSQLSNCDAQDSNRQEVWQAHDHFAIWCHGLSGLQLLTCCWPTLLAKAKMVHQHQEFKAEGAVTKVLSQGMM